MTRHTSSLTIAPDLDGSPLVRWDLSLEATEALRTALTTATTADAADLVSSLTAVISEARQFHAPDIAGCPGLWPEATPMTLDSPAVLRSTDDDTLCWVLIPGTLHPFEAAATALETAREFGIHIDSDDPDLFVDVNPARWMVLNTCESVHHDFHPELAMLGARTPGAVLLTRVAFTRNPIPVTR